ncbi:hypothetical protein RSAG8_13742, partial [Rhizoctonia solani AG-8 WAC10335]
MMTRTHTTILAKDMVIGGTILQEDHPTNQEITPIVSQQLMQLMHDHLELRLYILRQN